MKKLISICFVTILFFSACTCMKPLIVIESVKMSGKTKDELKTKLVASCGKKFQSRIPVFGLDSYNYPYQYSLTVNDNKIIPKGPCIYYVSTKSNIRTYTFDVSVDLNGQWSFLKPENVFKEFSNELVMNYSSREFYTYPHAQNYSQREKKYYSSLKNHFYFAIGEYYKDRVVSPPANRTRSFTPNVKKECYNIGEILTCIYYSDVQPTYFSIRLYDKMTGLPIAGKALIDIIPTIISNEEKNNDTNRYLKKEYHNQFYLTYNGPQKRQLKETNGFVESPYFTFGVDEFEVKFIIRIEGYKQTEVITSLNAPKKDVPLERIDSNVKITNEDPIDVKVKDSNELKERLTKLKELFDSGLISEKEYNQKKNEILNDL